MEPLLVVVTGVPDEGRYWLLNLVERVLVDHDVSVTTGRLDTLSFAAWQHLVVGIPGGKRAILLESPTVEAEWLLANRSMGALLVDLVLFVEEDMETSFCTNQTLKGLRWHERDATCIFEEVKARFEQVAAHSQQTLRLGGARSIGPFHYRDHSTEAVWMGGTIQSETAHMISKALEVNEVGVLQQLGMCGGSDTCHREDTAGKIDANTWKPHLESECLVIRSHILHALRKASRGGPGGHTNDAIRNAPLSTWLFPRGLLALPFTLFSPLLHPSNFSSGRQRTRGKGWEGVCGGVCVGRRGCRHVMQ